MDETSSRGWFTPFNIVAGTILAVGAVLLGMRFVLGLAATTNLSHDTPWGLWIGFDVMSGVALAAGGFVTSAGVYIFGMKEYKPIVRPAILTAFLGYFLVVLGLLVDLGRPWRLPYPFIVQSGPTSALFEVALCVALYLTTLFVETTPAVFEWLGKVRLRKLVGSLTITLTILGVILSTMHQSSLGALFSITPTRLHPLWYSSYLPVFFFVSAVAVGLSMVIVESMFAHRAFHDQVEMTPERFDRITLGLGKAAAVTLAIYFSMKLVGLAVEDEWNLLGTGWGAYFLVELLGFVLLPCIMFTIGFREKRTALVRIAAGITVIGVVLNRFNVSFIAYNWQLPAEARYVPSWMEVWITISLVTFGVVAYRWIASRMPILYEHPRFKGMH